MKVTTIGLAAALGLAACAQQAPMGVDPEGAAIAARNAPALEAVLGALEPLEGQPLDENLTLRDARAENGRLVMDLLLTDETLVATPASRDAFRFSFERDFAQQMCAAPALRTFVTTRGGLTANVSTQDGTQILSRSIETC